MPNHRHDVLTEAAFASAAYFSTSVMFLHNTPKTPSWLVECCRIWKEYISLLKFCFPKNILHSCTHVRNSSTSTTYLSAWTFKLLRFLAESQHVAEKEFFPTCQLIPTPLPVALSCMEAWVQHVNRRWLNKIAQADLGSTQHVRNQIFPRFCGPL